MYRGIEWLRIIIIISDIHGYTLKMMGVSK